MDVLWGRGVGDGAGGLTVREVLDALASRDLAYTTVMTVLDRLAGKGMVVRERDGQAWRYQPAAPREAYIAQLMLEALDLAQPGEAGDAAGTGGGRSAEARDRGAALVHFARSVSGDEAALLREALEEQARHPRSEQ